MRLKPAYLLVVVLVNELFDRFDRAVHGARSQQSGQGASQPSRQPPSGQQAAAMGRRQPTLDLLQVGLLGRQMPMGESAQHGVARKAQHAAVNAHGTSFARVVGAQIGHHLSWQGVAWGDHQAGTTAARRDTSTRLGRRDQIRHHQPFLIQVLHQP